MAISRSILGMNARNFIYIRKHNPPSAKRVADNKVRTKQLLLKKHIPTSNLLSTFENYKSIRDFNWGLLPNEGFVVKPARGYGGGGILVFKKWDLEGGETTEGRSFTKKQLESHLFDLLDGAYSLQYLPDIAYIEEVIKPHSFFNKISPLGLPDIRVIVFNKVPVMAMMRVPTEESGWKANLHIGAVAVGLRLKSGAAFHAILKNKPIPTLPENRLKIENIKIPFWDEILLLAAKTQAISGLGYAGVDIVVDEKRGPLVLEINSRPGLSIQLANKTSLRTRLERLEGLAVESPENGLEVAKSLFEPFSDKKAPIILSVVEQVNLKGDGQSKTIEAKIDTGAFRSSIDKRLASELGLAANPEQILVKSASGMQLRPAVNIQFELRGRSVKTVATMANRKHLRYPMIVGRLDLKGFLVDPNLPKIKEDQLEEKEVIQEIVYRQGDTLAK